MNTLEISRPTSPCPRRRGRRHGRGFTLVELMVVIAIIGLLASVVTVSVISRMGDARRTKVKADMRGMTDAINMFRIDLGYYPQQLQDLWQAPANARRWKGPYLTEYPPRDPWGNDYIYNYLSGNEFEIISYGADGAPGGTDEAEDLSSKTIFDEE